MRDVEHDLAWMKHLDKTLWRKLEADQFGHVHLTETRRLEESELQRILNIVATHRLPVTMHSACFGFGVGIMIHEPEPPAKYPGVEEKPAAVLFISKDHLPLSEAKSSMRDRTTFDDGWRVFSPLSHSDDNRSLLRRCGFPDPESRTAYSY